ncbi:hypothetical protein AAG570_001121 [Ranatra chinensis]|uniref:Endoplasmic reticulum-Golgi intermediate compartment protein 2 n=1 Tax=Ranatra chinensis TaxID=642074 RepID=A0ABD0YAX6_9HEMI
MLRNRKKPSSYGVELVRNLDTFPKLVCNSDDYVERSRIGGAVSLVTYIVIIWIVISETNIYFDSYLNFKFMPDTDYNAKLNLNLDMTIAMPCFSIGADILDSTSQNLLMFGNLEEEDTWFELSPEQESHLRDVRQLNTYLREEFHAIHHLLWKSGHSFLYPGMPKRSVSPKEATDGCRIFGSLELNKVAGNLHVTAGKSMPIPQGHVHISAFVGQSAYNFSHRIHHLSFGDPSAGIIHPLDGDEKITDQNMALYQYFIEVVPTDVQTFLSKTKTYQYSVKEHMRVIDHDKGSHGVAGIFFKYDTSALKVVVTQSHEPLLQFLIRLSSTLAGIFVTAGNHFLYSL